MAEHKKEENNSQQENKYSSVSFHPMVIVKKHLHLNDYTDAEIVASWYRYDDFYHMNQELMETLEMMEGGVLNVDNELFCTRGVESMTKDGTYQKYQNRHDSLMAVLEVQKQYKAGKCNERMISVVYTQQTQHCAKDAYNIGLKDLQAVTMSYTSVPVNNLQSDDIKLPTRSFRNHSSKIGLCQLGSMAA